MTVSLDTCSNEVLGSVSSHLWGKALLIRNVEQRLLQLFAEGKLFGTVHTCIGQEWTGIAVAESLHPGDIILSNHRGHGHFLARTDNVEGLIAEIMGKQSGVCGGRGGSQHIYSEGFFSNGIQGGMTAVGAGMAFALQTLQTDNIAVVFIGDGTLGEGLVYEALNIASKWALPLLIVVENNLYSQSTDQKLTLSGSISARAEAFGIRNEKSDTWNVTGLLQTTGECVGYVRSARRPLLLQIDTYRLMAHSKGDDDRDKAEVQSYWDRDPITCYCRDHPAQAAQFNKQIEVRLDAAVAVADSAPYAQQTDLQDTSPLGLPAWTRAQSSGSDRFVNLLHTGLQRNMQRDARVVLIGEDIQGPYGGAFKATKNLSTEFPGRVLNTPISEAALVGIGNGMALQGLLPVVEIMFGDFLTLAADQLVNHAAKFRYMYNDQVSVPLIVRTPMGGKRGYGATHSQCLEKHFLGVPGTRMLALNSRCDPGVVYDTVFENIDCPTIVIENKSLYSMRLPVPVPEGFLVEHDGDLFPTIRLHPALPPDVTILCYGGLLPEAEKAAERLFDEYDVVAEILCPMQIYPLNQSPILESVRKTRRLITVEEGQSFAAFGAETIAQLVELEPGVITGLRRIAAPCHPIPSCGPLEKALLPGTQHIVTAAVELVRS